MSNFLYWIGFSFFYIYFTIFHRWQIKGRKNVPDSGPLLIMANHTSNFDPPIVSCAVNQRVYYLGKKELFNNPVFNWLFTKLGVIPIKRGKPDISAIKKVFKIMDEKKMLVIFPEGTRNKPGKLGKPKAGAILIALKSKVPILPVGIKNIKNSKKSTEINIGQPFKLEKYYDRSLSRKEKKEAGKFIMNKIKEQIGNNN